MLERAFVNVYMKFKMHFYQEIFSCFQGREASLTTVETFCMESIVALGRPTINEFASFLGMSSPNAAYKVQSLIKKGYVEKIQSTEDRRIFYLMATQKYVDYYDISANYIKKVMGRINEHFSPEDCAKFEEMLVTISTELMQEIELPPVTTAEGDLAF